MKPVLADPLAAPACALGESPRWAHDRWWWVDAANGILWHAGPELVSGQPVRCQRLELGGRTSLVHPATHGRVVVAHGRDLVVVEQNGTRAPWARITLPTGWLLNDGTADPAGNLWVGSVHPEGRRHSGRLHRVRPDGAVRDIDGRTTLSNGMVWCDDSTLVHVDSRERELIYRTFHDHARPAACNVPVPPIPLPDSAAALTDVVLPDGVARDAAGGLWVALYGSARAVRLVDGQVHTVVELPTPRVTSVALGGSDGRDLVITTAQEDMDAAALAADPWAGRLFHTRVNTPSAPVLLVDPLANAASTT